MPPLKSKKPACKACGGTGVNSKEGPCRPCLDNLPNAMVLVGVSSTKGMRGLDRKALASVTKEAKAAYVRSQGQSREHHCHWPGCEAQCPPAQWGCKKHWFMLPKRLRDKVWAAYRPGQEVSMTPSREYFKVVDEVQRWIGENHPAKVKDIFDD